MINFEYTHYREVSSSAVDEIYYNANTKELAVDLNDSIYVYSNVSLETYDALVKASSVGRKFAEVKRIHGPSRFLGDYDNVEYIKVASMPSVAAVGTPKNLTYAPGAIVSGTTSTTTGEFRLTLGHKPLAEDDSVPLGISRDHIVLFNVEGLSGDREYKVYVASVDEAVNALSEATAALGLNVNVKEVTVYFE